MGEPEGYTNPYPKEDSSGRTDTTQKPSWDIRPADKCSNFNEMCYCDGQVRMAAKTYQTDWKDVDGYMMCDESPLGFNDLDFSLWNYQKWCECRERAFAE